MSKAGGALAATVSASDRSCGVLTSSTRPIRPKVRWNRRWSISVEAQVPDGTLALLRVGNERLVSDGGSQLVVARVSSVQPGRSQWLVITVTWLKAAQSCSAITAASSGSRGVGRRETRQGSRGAGPSPSAFPREREGVGMVAESINRRTCGVLVHSAGLRRSHGRQAVRPGFHAAAQVKGALHDREDERTAVLRGDDILAERHGVVDVLVGATTWAAATSRRTRWRLQSDSDDSTRPAISSA